MSITAAAAEAVTGAVTGAADGGESLSTTNGGLRRRWVWWGLLALVVTMGCVGRAWNIDFDQRQHLHPDERHWSLTSGALAADDPPARHSTLAGPLLDWLDGDRSPANPYRVSDSFVYGPSTLAAGRALAGWLHDGATHGAQPAALVVGALDRIGIPLLDDAGVPRFDDGYNVDLVGRLLGVVLDSLAIVVVALAGRRLGGPAVGLAAAFFHAASVLAIQHAHYFGSEPALALAAAATLWAVLAASRSDDRRAARRGGLLIGATAGATVAVKLSGVGVLLVAFGGLAVLAARHRRSADVVRVLAALIGAVLAVRVLLPGAFVALGWRPRAQFVDDMRSASAGAFANFPPAIQWAGRVPVLEVGGWLLRSTIGPGTAVAAGIGAVLLVVRRRQLGGYPVAMVLGMIVVPALTVVRGPVTTGRYFVPMLPALAVAAGYGVVTLWSASRGAAAWRRRTGTAALAAIAVAASVWPLALVAGVYGHEHTRIAASRWIADHVPAGAVLSHQAWDDALPLYVAGVDPGAYHHVQLELWDVDSIDKLARLAEQLTGIDYVVESSPRVWNSVVRLPERFPSTIELFDALDDGRLGFERVATFTGPPRLGPLRLDSNAVEEAFSVYDHPEVRIWQRVADVDAASIVAALDPRAAANAVMTTPAQATTHAARLTAGERAANARAPSFDDTFARSGVMAAPMVQTLGWVVIVALLALAAWALAAPVLSRLPDAGAGMAPTLGLVIVVAATVVLSGGLGLVLSRGLVSAIVAVLLVTAAVVVQRQAAAVRERWRSDRRTIVTAVVVSAAGGLLALATRLLNPDLWHRQTGGEKPFELAMLTSVLRARTLPPPDLWFSGGALNYYYGGSLLVATPARVMRTAPDIAFNLGVGLIGALAAGAAFSAGVAVWALGCAARDRTGCRGDVATARRARGARRAGVLAAAFVVVVPNVAAVVAAVRHVFGGAGGRFDWWAPSRVVPGQPLVTEFPAWTLTFGDLHAHLIGLPVMLTLAAASCAGLLLLARRDHRPAVPVLCLAGALVGLLAGAARMVNTWDLPVAAVLVVVTAASAAVLVARRQELRAPGMWMSLGGAAVCAAAAFVVPWLPFTRRFLVDDFGIDRVVDPTPLTSLLAQFGMWALVSVVGVVMTVGPALRRWLGGWRRRHRADPARASAAGVVGIAVGGVALVVAAWLDGRLALAAAVCLAVGTAGGALVVLRGGDLPAARGRRSRPSTGESAADSASGDPAPGETAPGETVPGDAAPGERATGDTPAGDTSTRDPATGAPATGMAVGFVCLALGWAAIAVIEVISLDDGVARMNTVFKGWFQAWWLLAIGSATVVAALLGRRMVIGRGLLAAVAAMACVFAAVLVPARLATRDGEGVGLQGLAFLDGGMSIEDNGVAFDPGDDLPLIEWLRANVTGFPTVAEAPGRGYSWTGRVASYAGLPTVIGWPYHQSQQRPGDGAEITRRVDDITALYWSHANRPRALTVLWRYDIAYVVFGTAERALTADDPRAGAAIRALPCTEEVVAHGRGFVLAVDQSCVEALVVPTLAEVGQR